jgi:2-polyprenyl-3-methyl-5-hydroxy-6-metoxy-1,4-benzoquinol methylase
MPKSSKENKDIAKQWHDELLPEVVLDIGPGQGTYAALCKKAGQRWIGVEAWAPYIEQFDLTSLYDEVIVADVRYINFDKLTKNIELVIMGDVLEHMKKDDAKNLIQHMFHRYGTILISVPLKHLDQGAWQGNWFETHVDHWHHKEMMEFLNGMFPERLEYKTGKVLGYYLCSNSV